MAGIPTEHLADQIRETNQRLTESHERLSDEIHDLNHRFDVLIHKFDDFRVEITEKLGAINANLEGFRGRTETAFRVAVWGISVAATVAIAGIGAVIAGTWYAAKLDSRMERVESRLDKEFPAVPALKRP
jgi:hypothetical protein